MVSSNLLNFSSGSLPKDKPIKILYAHFKMKADNTGNFAHNVSVYIFSYAFHDKK
jgi:hypothetical protein